LKALRESDSAREFLASGAGRAGSLFFLTLVAISLYVLATYPIDFGIRLWNNPAVWADNPKLAPPAWVNLVGGHRRAEHEVIELQRPTEIHL
jgi:peptide/nickel transport system permease protein